MLIKYKHNEIISPLRPTLLMLSLVIMATTVPLSTYAAPIEEHGSTEIDATAPIAALDKLDSLKQVSELEFKLPTIHHFKSISGVPVSFVRTTQIPIVDVDLRFNAGSAHDEDIRKGGYGIANMTAAMLTQGTVNYDEDTFAATVEKLGLALNTAAYRDMFIVSLRSLSNNAYLVPASLLLQDIITNPTFDNDILQRNKDQLQLGLQQQLQSPGYVANIAFMNALYADHPYAHPSSGTLESVPTLTQEDLMAFKQKFLVANNANLAITGDLTLQEAKALADNITGMLAAGAKPSPLPQPTPLKELQRIDIAFDSTQTTVLIGQIGDKRTTDLQEIQKQTDFSIANEILAGSDFNARLMTEIRKKRGLTYGISGDMTPMQVNGPYVIGFSSRQDKAQEAIDTSLEIIQDTVDNGVNEEELALTKESFINSYPMNFTSNASINGQIATLGFYHLPDSYLTDYIPRVNNTSLNSANAALHNTLNPSQFLIVTVGAQE